MNAANGLIYWASYGTNTFTCAPNAPTLAFQQAWNAVYGGSYGGLTTDSEYGPNSAIALAYVAQQFGLARPAPACMGLDTAVTVNPPLETGIYWTQIGSLFGTRYVPVPGQPQFGGPGAGQVPGTPHVAPAPTPGFMIGEGIVGPLGFADGEVRLVGVDAGGVVYALMLPSLAPSYSHWGVGGVVQAGGQQYACPNTGLPVKVASPFGEYIRYLPDQQVYVEYTRILNTGFPQQTATCFQIVDPVFIVEPTPISPPPGPPPKRPQPRPQPPRHGAIGAVRVPQSILNRLPRT